MSHRRPLASLVQIHPEYLARAARDGNDAGRFYISIQGDVDRVAAGWAAYESRRGDWPDPRIVESAFDPGFRVVLAAMRACRLFGLTPKLRREEPGTPEAWLARCTTAGAGRTLDVLPDAPGARDDLAAWWWIVTHVDPVITCDAAAFDAATLFTIGNGLRFATARFLPKSVLAHAKSEGDGPGAVALHVRGGDDGWGALVVAAPPTIGALAIEGVRGYPATEEQARRHETIDTSILAPMQASSFWTNDILSHNFEKKLVATFNRSLAHPDEYLTAIYALAAAEGVAIAEGREPTSRSGMSETVAGFIRAKARDADPLCAETIDLALRAVQTVTEAGAWERRTFQSERGRADHRLEVAGLRTRLLAAQATRRARSRAANAVPVPDLREIPLVPRNWRRLMLHALFDDAVALVGGLRDETGATVLVTMADRTLRPLHTEWDARELLARIEGDPFDARDIDWRASRSWPWRRGAELIVWWPDVSPEPEIREAGDRWCVIGWGHAELTLCGATPDRVLWSSWRHPTGTERREPKFAGPGPWHDVDWPQLRRRTRAVRRLLEGSLGATAVLDVRALLTLPAAAADASAGRRRLNSWWR
jgi:hypothetical protein